MKNQAFNTTVLFYPQNSPFRRLFALWYFTVLMVIWNVLGHTVLGFEQSWASPVAGVASAILFQMLLDWVDARAKNREPRFLGSFSNFANFLPAAIIPGFACAMLLYPNERLTPIIFAVALSIGSKVIFRAPVGGGRTQHIFNPSNFGVAATLLIFPSVGFAPPYHFTENLTGWQDWMLPGIVLVTGVIVHGGFTGRLPLVAAWIIGFIIQGVIRAKINGVDFFVPLTPMTSAAFILFTLYMVPDPATTPLHPVRQALFGASVAAVYGVIQMLHLVFGLFFALITVCAIRGISLHLQAAFSGGTSPQAPALADSKPSPAGVAFNPANPSAVPR